MRSIIFVFAGVFITLYGLVNFYIYVRGGQAIAQGSVLKGVYAISFWTIALSFFAGRYLENIWPSGISQLLVWIGSFWIAAMFYFFFAVVFLDLLRLINWFFPFFPARVVADYPYIKVVAALTTMALVAAILLAGFINSLFPRIRTLDLSIDKQAHGMKVINIVAASDIHLGTIVGRKRMDRIVETINRLKPDVVLFPGDIVDEDLAPVVRQNLGETLRSMKPRYGVYGVTGNHEYIGGVEEACAYLTEHNVVMLRDQTVKVNGAFYLLGREDNSYRRFADKERKPLEELMSGIDKSFPIILMDHQPFRLHEGAENDVDLQLSGHTHNGQLWPVNYIVNAIFEVAWGYKKLANTHIYVSSGVGTWGPPVRIGHRPEIVNIRLRLR
jgi:uncharacterized protein